MKAYRVIDAEPYDPVTIYGYFSSMEAAAKEWRRQLVRSYNKAITHEGDEEDATAHSEFECEFLFLDEIDVQE